MKTGHRVAALLGLAFGALVVGAFWPGGGYDAYHFFVKDYFPGTTIPAWGYLLLQPLGRIPFPWSWGILNALTMLATGWAADAFGWHGWRWFVPVLSAPLLLNIWFGQVEVFPAVGTALGWLVVQRRARDVWLGVAWMCLLVKPQSGLVALLLLTWWFLADKHNPWPAIAVAAGIFGLTLVVWGWWLGDLFDQPAVGLVGSGDAIWPYGLIFLPLAFLPTRQRQTKLILAMSAGTLAGPYFFLHHILTVQIVSASLLLWVGTALMMGLSLFAGVELSWVLPLVLAVFVLVTAGRELLSGYPAEKWNWLPWPRSKEEQSAP